MSVRRDKLDPFVRSVAAFIDARGLIPAGARIVAGVSGGADSVAMLRVLGELAGRDDRRWSLIVAHLNHRLRPDADADERFVAELARHRGLQCVADRVDVAGEVGRSGESVEQAGRRLRYEFLRDTAGRVGASHVAVAHHADDNVETILYRIVRGTHLRGLAGIPASRELGGSSVGLVRPLLDVSRDEVEAFCRRAGLDWRTDATNADVAMRRNLIRHELLPLLRERLNPRADEALLRLASAADEVETFFAARAERLLAEACRAERPGRTVLDAETLAGAPVAIRRHALRAALERAGAPLRNLDAERLGELGELAGGGDPSAVALPGGFIVCREGGEIVISSGAGDPAAPVVAETPVALIGETELGDGRRIVCDVGPLDADAFAAHRANPSEGIEMLDADQLRGPLRARARRAGDVFRPLGAPGRQSVGELLTNRKIPSRLRDEIVCVCDGLGIVYVAPLAIDERVRVTGRTRRVLRVRILPAWRPGAEGAS